MTPAEVAWTITAIILAINAAALGAMWLRFSREERVRRRQSPSASFDRHAEEAVRLVRPVSTQWTRWQ